MRKLLGLAVVAIASCSAPQPPTAPAIEAAVAPAFTAGGDQFLDQGWSAADRESFATSAQGSYMMPLAWFQALRRTDRDEAFAADQLERYGYLRSSGALPVGFVRDGVGADPQIGMTCAACHTGKLSYRGQTWRIDGGRANADFQGLLTDLGVASRATLAEPDRFAAFAARVLGSGASKAAMDKLQRDFAAWTDRYTDFMAASLPTAPWGPGRLDAFGMIFNRVAGLDLQYPKNLEKADAPVRYPFIWDAPRQDRTQWTGAAPNGTYLRGLARNTGEVFGVFGRFDPVAIPFRRVLHRNSVNLASLQNIEEKVVALRPPAWPRSTFGLDPARVSQGGQIFKSECAGCHGIKPSGLVSNAWDTKVQDVGTDRRTFENSKRTGSPQILTGTQQPPIFGDRLTDPSPKVEILANAVVGTLLRAVLLHDSGVRRAINRDFAEDRLPIVGAAPTSAPEAAIASATQALYKAADGEPGAAYEARVLTGIWAVGPYLHNGSVPSLWELLKPARERMTQFAVGHGEFDPLHVGLETTPAPGRATFVVDHANGNGNGGHEYGTTLSETDRWSLVEYLKTL